ncbi:DUF2612 domain-containing protein [Serratia aquatilis]|uniref:DUF2612 domain-containing protein n=1 Tax=Serratia aquatilis TaxID=1737515 RepID=A0ABV6EIX3_9GAMM
MNETKYQRLITSYHKNKPRFYDHISLITHPLINLQRTTNGLLKDFDLDAAVGSQLDVLGLWIGINREVITPIVGYSLQSIEVNEGGATQSAIRLDDETYRTVLRAKIQANHWDGTLETLDGIYQSIFTDGQVKVLVIDNFDMTMTIYFFGSDISPVLRAVIKSGYLDVKPEGVGVRYVIADVPLFGFDLNNEFTAGFDSGAWGILLGE